MPDVRPRLWGRSSVSYSLGVALCVIGFAAALLLFVEVAFFSYTSPSVDWYIYAFFAACVAYNASGLLLWWFRPSNTLGAIMVGVGFVWLIVGLTTLPNRPVAGFGTLLQSAPVAGLFHILLAFPSGRLRTAWARFVVAAMWVLQLTVIIPIYLYSGGPLSVDVRPDIVHTWDDIQLWTGFVPGVIGSIILVDRIRRTAPRLRAVLWPLYLYGVLAIYGLPVTKNLLGPRLGLGETTIEGLQFIVVGLAPIFFAAAALSGAFGRTGRIDELAAWLGTSGSSERDAEQVIGRTLGDASARLLFWLEEQNHYVDESGATVLLPDEDEGRGIEVIEIAGRRVGAIVYDSELISDPQPVRAAARVLAISVDRERLLAELRASQEALRQSRTRLVEAGDRERRRIARNLHDGIQVQLVMLGIDAQTLASDPQVSAPTREAVTTLRSRIDAAAGELRQLVHAVMPAPLLERGLVAAVEDLIDRMPITTTLTVGRLDESLPPPVQTTAYFIVAEALTNVMKHARAHEVAMWLDQSGNDLVVTVSDDGVGGATLSGNGLRGLTDRAEALGGRLSVESPEGAGTTLVAHLPRAAVPILR
jgi:signal transduction histidine kinase